MPSIPSCKHASQPGLLRMRRDGYMASCEGQAAAPAPSSSPLSPPLPDQPGVNTTSSASGSAPVAAIAGGLVGAVAAVAGELWAWCAACSVGQPLHAASMRSRHACICCEHSAAAQLLQPRFVPIPAVCLLLVLGLRRRRRRRQQLATSAGKAVNELGPEGLDSSKATSSQALSLASSGSAGIGAAVPPALASDPLVSLIMASQPSSKYRKGSGTSALRSQGSGSTQVREWELDWADLKLQCAVGSGSYGKVGGGASAKCFSQLPLAF